MSRLNAIRARVEATDPRWIDAAVAAAFAVAIVLESALIDAHGKSRVLTAVLGVAMSACIAFRRRAPEPAIVALSAVVALSAAVGDNFLLDNTNTPFVAILFMLYSLGRHAERLWPAFALYTGAVVLSLALSKTGLKPGDLVWLVFMFGLPALAGRALRGRALLQHELREKARVAEAERRLRARRATDAERDRIAAELQAVVANGVSAMVVQAEAVPRVIGGGDTARAAESLAVIEETGRDALMEMRRLLGVLRRDDEGAALAPQPGLGRLEALVERQHGRGLAVELRLDGDRRPAPPGVDLTAYRVLEDALHAAVDHGAGNAQVLVRYRDRELQLEVIDDREGSPMDRLAGLRDRVGLYGGHLSVQRDDGVGFRLRARLPLEETAR